MHRLNVTPYIFFSALAPDAPTLEDYPVGTIGADPARTWQGSPSPGVKSGRTALTQNS